MEPVLSSRRDPRVTPTRADGVVAAREQRALAIRAAAGSGRGTALCLSAAHSTRQRFSARSFGRARWVPNRTLQLLRFARSGPQLHVSVDAQRRAVEGVVVFHRGGALAKSLQHPTVRLLTWSL
jgi:hypothetical protein